MPGRTALLVGVLASVLALAGCVTASPAPNRDGVDNVAGGTSWFESCPAAAPASRPVTSGSPTVASGSPATGTARPEAGASRVPPVSLPCMGPGGAVNLGGLGVSTVVNVWASWCAPCRKELPAFQRYAKQHKTPQVLGVVSGDTREASLALARDLGVTFPTLYDKDASLIRALGRNALPVTLFITPGGELAYVYNGEPLTEDGLAALVDKHLGVR